MVWAKNNKENVIHYTFNNLLILLLLLLQVDLFLAQKFSAFQEDFILTGDNF